MHPFVHAFSPAIDPPFESRTDFDAFHAIGRRFSELARTHLGVRRDVVAVPLQHDTPGETAQPGGRVLDWRAGEVAAVPGRTMPNFVAVERDYPAVAEKMASIGPLVDRLGMTTKAVTYHPDEEIAYLSAKNGVMLGGAGDGRPAIDTDAKMAEAILALSGDDQRPARGAGLPRAGAAHRYSARRPCRGQRGEADHLRRHPGPAGAGDHQPGVVGQRDRRAPLRPVHRQRRAAEALAHPHRADAFLLDHDWMHEMGETLPIYRSPLDMHRLFGDRPPGTGEDGASVTVRYLTPHSKWSIHSEYQDNLFMLSLSRGGPTVWMSEPDATRSGCATTTGSRRSTATGCWWRGRSSPTACRRAPCSSTTRRSGW